MHKVGKTWFIQISFVLQKQASLIDIASTCNATVFRHHFQYCIFLKFFINFKLIIAHVLFSLIALVKVRVCPSLKSYWKNTQFEIKLAKRKQIRFLFFFSLFLSYNCHQWQQWDGSNKRCCNKMEFHSHLSSTCQHKEVTCKRKVKDLFKNIYFEADITWDIFYSKVF